MATSHTAFAVTHTAPNVLPGVLERIAAQRLQDAHPVVVFDLDGTLFDNGPRTWQVLYEFALQRRRHALLKRLQGVARLSLPYTLKDILALCGETDGELLREVVAFWKERFFRDDYIRYDEPLAGAIQFATACWDAGATVVYLTGRDAPNMLLGTSASLRTHCFPVGVPRSVLTLKEAFEVEDLAFKREALEFLDTLGVVVAAFDNEPANCNLFQNRWPDAEQVCVATAHAPNPPVLHPSVKVIKDFVE